MNSFIKKILFFFFIPDLFFAQVRHNLFIPLSTGDSLDATYFIPLASPPQSGYPVIIFVHGFGQNKNSDTASARIYAYGNYFTLCYSVRGHGQSSGLSTIMSNRERQDLKEVIQFVENLAFVDSNSIGVIGGSQGGLHALWSIADSISNCAIADVILPNWASNLFTQGAIKRMFGVILKNFQVRYHPVRDTLWNLLLRDNYDSLITIFPINRDLSLLEFQNKNIPLMLMLKYQDHYFEARDGIEFFTHYDGIKKLYLGTGGHFSDSIEEEWYYQFSWITNWFNQFLKNINTGILELPVYTYAYSQLPMDSAGYFSWVRNEVNELPFNQIVYHRFYFHSDSTVKYSYPISTDFYFSLLNKYKDTNYNFETAYADNFSGARFDSAFEKNTITFISDLFNEDVFMFGVPKAKLFFIPNTDKIPINLQIYEQDSLNNKYFLTRINYVGRSLENGILYNVEINGNFYSHKFKKGNRICIEITNIDKTNRLVFGQYPFVFPVFKSSETLIAANSNYASYIELPLLKTDYILRIEDGIISNYELNQNYPNPFNSETNIEYSIKNDANINLTVFDILGREIKVLFSGSQKSGKYRATFNAKNLSSGIYFYKLEVTDQSNKLVLMKKMLLIK